MSSDRQLTQFGAGQIPAASIDRATQGWPDEEAALFRRMMRALDAVWLDHQAKSTKDPKPEPKAGYRTVSAQPMTPRLFMAMFATTEKER